jgi:hypothetical protein
LVLCTVWAPAVFAQSAVDTRSDSADPPRQASPNQKGSASQTLGTRDKDLSTRRLENTSEGLAPPGGVYGVGAGMGGEPFSDGVDAPPAPPPPGGVPETHVVQKGDTLWTLCSRYFNDPWRWPRLWAANPAITNPHWIFPGDVIRLGEATAPAAAPGSAPVGGKQSEDQTSLFSNNRSTALASNSVVLREVGLIEAQDLAVAATLSGSREEKILLATGDQVYLRFPKERPLRAGERYTIFQTDANKPVVDPETGRTFGYLVRVRGDLTVDQIADEGQARGTLVDVVEPIERGYRVSNLIHQFKRVEPRPSDVNLEARVVASFAPTQLLGAEQFVVLNRGKRDGVQVGNRTFVVRRGDGYRNVLEAWEKHDPNYPKEVVGEIWVVDVRDTASVAWIVRSSKELRIGELTEMRKGH